MSHADARKAIESKLVGWAQALPIGVAFGTEKYTPVAEETYLRAFLLPASTQVRYLSGDAEEYRGIYQVSIICQSGEPVDKAEQIIAALKILFPIDSEIVYGNTIGMVVEPVARGPQITNDTGYAIPANFTYRCIA